jgi:hypothetical protein
MNITVIRQRLNELTAARDEIEIEIRVLKNLLHSKTRREATLTAEELRDILSYDPETGYFLWKKHRLKNKIGTRAGRLHMPDGYRLININGIAFYEQRLAWLYVTGEWPVFIVDHDNENKADNRFHNLKDVSWSGNNIKRQLHLRNTSGETGVSLHKCGRWRAALWFNGRQVYHKLFSTKEEAAAAYAEQRAIYHGNE